MGDKGRQKRQSIVYDNIKQASVSNQLKDKGAL